MSLVKFYLSIKVFGSIFAIIFIFQPYSYPLKSLDYAVAIGCRDYQSTFIWNLNTNPLYFCKYDQNYRLSKETCNSSQPQDSRIIKFGPWNETHNLEYSICYNTRQRDCDFEQESTKQSCAFGFIIEEHSNSSSFPLLELDSSIPQGYKKGNLILNASIQSLVLANNLPVPFDPDQGSKYRSDADEWIIVDAIQRLKRDVQVFELVRDQSQIIEGEIAKELTGFMITVWVQSWLIGIPLLLDILLQKQTINSCQKKKKFFKVLGQILSLVCLIWFFSEHKLLFYLSRIIFSSKLMLLPGSLAIWSIFVGLIIEVLFILPKCKLWHLIRKKSRSQVYEISQ